MVAQPIHVDLDLNQNELQNAVAQNLSSAPANPVTGQEYFNTNTKKKYIWDGTEWVDETSQGGGAYTAGTGINSSALAGGTVAVDTSVVALKTDIGDGAVIFEKNGTPISTISVNQTSTSTVDFTIPTQASDIGALPDTTTIGAADTVIEKNGTAIGTINANATTAGTINVTAMELTDLSIASSSTNYLGYDSSTGQISAKVDTTVTSSSTNLVTSGAVDTAINNAITGGMVYKGVWTATGQTDYSSITLPVKAGYMYLVSGSATITAGGTTIEWNTDDYLVVNANVASGGTLTDVKKIDNTEGSDIVRLNATQTLTNKTIDADDNTILDLTTSNLKSGVLQTTIRTTSTATDATLPSELAVATALNGKANTYTTTNGALTASSGICTWTVTHNLGSKVSIHVYEVSTGIEIVCYKEKTSSSVATIKLNSTSNISADTYEVVVIGN